jgi:hypothetical protein
MKKKRAREEDEKKDDEDEESFTDNDDGEPYEGFHCSYGFMQTMRIWLIEATLKYLDEYKNSTAKKCKERIESWIKNIPDEYKCLPINYEEVQNDNLEPDMFRKLDILGLIHFVMHSDCDGYLSEGETLDVARLLQNLMPYFNDQQKQSLNPLLDFCLTCLDDQRGLSYH